MVTKLFEKWSQKIFLFLQTRAGESGGERGRGGEGSGKKWGWGAQITSIIGMKENCYRKTANVIGKKSIANLSSRFVLSFKLKGH